MKKLIHMIIIVLLLVAVSPLISPQEQKEIVEEVSVNWWQVPLFAVDKEGNPVNSLEPEDIEIRMNGIVIPQFVLNKRDFSVRVQEEETAAETPAPAPPLLKKKLVVFLFDLTLSSKLSVTLSKQIAKEIIAAAKEETQFIILSGNAFAGLEYIGAGSGSNKNELLTLVEKIIITKKNARYINIGEFFNLDIGTEGDEIKGLSTQVSKYYFRKNLGFFNSFYPLYLYLNSIEDNKFIYLFTEGLSEGIKRNLQSEYRYFLKQAASLLNRCGGTLFIINPSEAAPSSFSSLSGEESLRYLAQESGGVYLAGQREKITRQIENLHRSYYEISFPDDPRLKDKIREIDVKAKKEDIWIYSLHALEKRKPYHRMNDMEKEMLVLSLLTQPDNAILQRTFSAYNARVEKTKHSKKNITYTVSLPPGYINNTLDLYKVWLTVDNQGTAQVEKMARETLCPRQDKLEIPFPLEKDKKTKKEGKESGGELQAYFVLVNGAQDPARASVHGLEFLEEDPGWEALAQAKAATQPKSGKTISPAEMDRLLQGAADYCERIKQSAFHFYCREHIVETREPLSDVDKDIPNISLRAMKRGVVRTMDEIRNKAYTQVKSFEFGYRLIKQGSNIKEERDYISSSDEIKVNRDQVITTNAFFSQKAIFAPVTLLDRSRQDSYHYQFVDFDQYRGRPVAIIAATPKDPTKSLGIYGKIWIDTGDFSVMKIEADPQSIRGYDKLKELAGKLKTRLYLTLESEFHALYNGIRLPTKVSMQEKYKGGRIISEFRGPKSWERTRTEFSYVDYQFFDVNTDVTVH